MVVKYVLLISVLLSTNLSLWAQRETGFVLEGTIENLKDGATIYLILDKDTAATSKTKDSHFQIKGIVSGEANYYFLKLDSQINNQYSEALWLTNAKMVLKGKLEEWPKLELYGSEPHCEYLELRKLHSQVQNTDSEIRELKDFVNRHRNSLYVSDLILKMSPVLKINGLDSAYNKLTPRAKSSYYGQQLRDRIQNTKHSPLYSPSRTKTEQLPNFKYTSFDGQDSYILDAIGKSKYTLIDFWASWCSPCRAAIPAMKKVYKKYHPKGFNIIGISIDKKEADWKKALKEDNTEWDHGIDNIENVGKTIFDFSAIPAYFIVDEKGTVIRSSYHSKKYRSNKAFSIDQNLHDIIKELLEK